MLKIIYGPEGHPVSDYHVFDWVDYNILRYKQSSYPTEVHTCNENVLNTFAMRVLDGSISLDGIEFYFENEKLEFDPILGLQNPKGKQMGIFQEIMDKSLKYSYDLMKKTREKK